MVWSLLREARRLLLALLGLFLGRSVSEARPPAPVIKPVVRPALPPIEPMNPEEQVDTAETAGAADAAAVEETPQPVLTLARAAVQHTQGSSNGDGAYAPTEAPDAEENLLVVAGGVTMSLSAALESLLFVAEKPVLPEQMARVLGVETQVVDAGLRRLDAELVAAHRGLRVQFQQDRVRLVTRPDAAGAIEEFLNLDLTARLSTPALETLAVIAYRQPVTRSQIEAVRGVDCGGVLRTLVQRGLVEEMGRLEAVGRPYLYGVTEQFMHHFGLIDIKELPPLEAREADLLASVEDTESPAASESADISGS